MNLENFERLKKAIRDNADGFDMRYWGRISDTSPYGTVGCFAGFCDWLMALDGHNNTLFDKSGRKLRHDYEYGAWGRGCDFLNISKDKSLYLFYLHKWPNDHRMSYERARTNRGKANAAIKRIDHFIKHGE
jgi:hypothetical protein